MRKDLARLAELSALTEAEFQSQQVRMARLRQREDEIRGKIAEIEADRAAQLAGLHPADPAVRAGAVLAWETWVEQRQKSLAIDLARLRVEMDQARDALARSFGRDAALKELIGHRRAKARLDVQRGRIRGPDRKERPGVAGACKVSSGVSWRTMSVISTS